ncbi:MAG: YraN family protein [Candidatus Gracilibacteria bacterium]
MDSKRLVGMNGESLACTFLEKKGYQILDRNFSSRYGELDIIAKKEDEYVFVEVKTRSQWSAKMVSGEESVTSAKRKRMLQTIQVYFAKKNFEFEIPWRCDVIVIEVHRHHYRIIHYPYAFEVYIS